MFKMVEKNSEGIISEDMKFFIFIPFLLDVMLFSPSLRKNLFVGAVVCNWGKHLCELISPHFSLPQSYKLTSDC